MISAIAVLSWRSCSEDVNESFRQIAATDKSDIGKIFEYESNMCSNQAELFHLHKSWEYRAGLINPPSAKVRLNSMFLYVFWSFGLFSKIENEQFITMNGVGYYRRY